METTRARKAIAAEVRAAVARAGMHQTSVAQAIGMSTGTMSRRVNAESPFTVEELCAIAAELGVGVRTLLPESIEGEVA